MKRWRKKRCGTAFDLFNGDASIFERRHHSAGIFPKEIRHIAAFLPSTYWIQGIGNAVLGESVKREAAISIFYGAGFFIMSVYFRSRRSGSSRK